MLTTTRRTPTDVLACAERPAASFALQLPALQPDHYVERETYGTEDDAPRKNGPQHGNTPIYQRCGTIGRSGVSAPCVMLSSCPSNARKRRTSSPPTTARPKCNRRSMTARIAARSRIVSDDVEESVHVCRVRTDMCAFLEDGRRLLDRDSGELRIKASSQDDFDGIATATSRYL